MGKYADLINGLFERGKFRRGNYEALVKANAGVVPFLCDAMKNHEDECVREVCAEILGERGSPAVIPALIESLRDESIYVRQDALWSIERICLYSVNALMYWLDLNVEEPDDWHARVLEWWNLNRRYIENNENLSS